MIMGTKNYDSATDMITFSRASSATFLGSNGLLQTAANNIPRIEYDATGAVKGLLIEEARTNFMTSSGDVAGTGWTTDLSAGTVTAGSPLGTYQTMSPTSTGTGSNGAKVYQIGKTLTSGATYVVSALVKYSAGSGWFIVMPYNTSPSFAGSNAAWFDLQNGVVGSKDAAIIDHGMIDYGDGWWLCWASKNAGSTSGGASLEVVNANGSLDRSAADTLLIAGTQFELGAFHTSYIPTSGASATRAADRATIPTSAFGYNSGAGTVVVDFNMSFDGTNYPRVWEIGSTINNNDRIALTGYAPTGVIGTGLYTAGVGQGGATLSTGNTVPTGTLKVAFAWRENDLASVQDGGTVITDTAATITGGNPRTMLALGKSAIASAEFVNGHIKSIQYYPRRLSDTQLQELTT
jgi:hypothetical protein